MKYSDNEYVPEVGDLVEYHYENYPPDRARVAAVGRTKIKITYENDSIKPHSEYVDPAKCDFIARES